MIISTPYLHRTSRRLVVLLLAFASALWGQGAKNPSGTQSATPNPAATATPNPAAGSPAPTPGVTSGTLPIESTLFAYKALTADARAIAAEICPAADTCKDRPFVVVLPTDVAAIVQWRAVLGQIDVLTNRTSANAVDSLAPPNPYTPPPLQLEQMPKFAAIVASSSDIQNLAQTLTTLASAFAVNEALIPAAGAISDAPLMNMVSRELEAKGATVYIPSVYPPSLLANANLTGTIIFEKLTQLETNRTYLAARIQQYTQALDDAARVAKDTSVTNDQKVIAANFNSRSKSVTALITTLTALESAIDTFEGTLFSGQSPTPQSQNPSPQSTNQQGQGGAPVSPLAGGGPQTTQPAQPTSPPISAMPQLSNTAGSGTTLQQILLADLLARQIWSRTTPDQQQLDKLHMVTVHALESGGGQLTKSRLFTGTKVYFGGGSVATYSLFRSDGSVQCAGIAYGYRGYVREKNFEQALAGPALPAFVDTPSACKQ